MSQRLYSRVTDIKKSSSEEFIKTELYSVLTEFILSDKIFKRNFQIKHFLEDVDPYFSKELLPYVYDNRALLLGRVLKIVSIQDKNFNYNLVSDIKSYLKIFNSKEETEIINSNLIYSEKENYTDKLFKKHKRNIKNNE